MKELFFVCCMVLFSFSCTDDSGGGGGGCVTASDLATDRFASKSPVNTVSEALVMEYLNPAGINLIENGTYNPSQISLNYGTYTQTEVVDLINEKTKYLIWVTGFSKGKNRIYITLSPSETDTLFLYANEIDFSSCTGPKYAIDSLSYNGETQSSKKIADGLQKLTVIK